MDIRKCSAALLAALICTSAFTSCAIGSDSSSNTAPTAVSSTEAVITTEAPETTAPTTTDSPAPTTAAPETTTQPETTTESETAPAENGAESGAANPDAAVWAHFAGVLSFDSDLMLSVVPSGMISKFPQTKQYIDDYRDEHSEEIYANLNSSLPGGLEGFSYKKIGRRD